jgi:hypothetical protein
MGRSVYRCRGWANGRRCPTQPSPARGGGLSRRRSDQCARGISTRVGWRDTHRAGGWRSAARHLPRLRVEVDAEGVGWGPGLWRPRPKHRVDLRPPPNPPPQAEEGFCGVDRIDARIRTRNTPRMWARAATKKGCVQDAAPCRFWRRGGDSNPRGAINACLISSQVHSTTLPPLRWSRACMQNPGAQSYGGGAWPTSGRRRTGGRWPNGRWRRRAVGRTAAPPCTSGKRRAPHSRRRLFVAPRGATQRIHTQALTWPAPSTPH